MLLLQADADSCELSHVLKNFLHDCRMHGVDPFDFKNKVDPEPETWMAGHEAARQELEDFLRDCQKTGVDPFDFEFKIDPEPEMLAIFSSWSELLLWLTSSGVSTSVQCMSL